MPGLRKSHSNPGDYLFGVPPSGPPMNHLCVNAEPRTHLRVFTFVFFLSTFSPCPFANGDLPVALYAGESARLSWASSMSRLTVSVMAASSFHSIRRSPTLSESSAKAPTSLTSAVNRRGQVLNLFLKRKNCGG